MYRASFAFFAVVISASLFFAGCAPAETDTADASVIAGNAQSSDPIEAIHRWRQWRDQRRYRLIEAHIDPDQRATFIDTLICVDMFLEANDQVGRAVAEVIGDYRFEEWDLSIVAQSLGLFSEPIEIIRVDRDGERAVVVYQAADRLPLENADLRADPDGWVYLPGAGNAALPAAFRGLAATLSDIAVRIRSDSLNRDQINREFRLRVWPRLMTALKLAQPLSEDAPAQN